MFRIAIVDSFSWKSETNIFRIKKVTQVGGLLFLSEWHGASRVTAHPVSQPIKATSRYTSGCDSINKPLRVGLSNCRQKVVHPKTHSLGAKAGYALSSACFSGPPPSKFARID